MRSKRLTIGIDLGGTKIATGLVDAKGRLLGLDVRPSKSPKDSEIPARRRIQFCIDSMADAVVHVISDLPGKTLKQKSKSIQGVGLAAAGPLDVERGLIVNPYNFEGWGVVPVVKLLSRALVKRGLALPVHFQNDAMAAALGEGWVGRTKTCTSYATITLGTGVGTGVVLNGRPAQSRGMGSEWGHMLVNHMRLSPNDLDPYPATVEGVASGTGMMRLAQELGLACASPAELADFARQRTDGAGDIARRVFLEASRSLAALFYNLSIGYNLDKFVFTGGLLPIQDLFVPRAIELYKIWIENTAPAFVAPVVVSKLGNKAGVIGAARLPMLHSTRPSARRTSQRTKSP
ncbi:MAG: ROK family protein [Bdellovibrionaceae bacterium]|nr:ROK family protein [Pseudobdellovibrionaceae bacterium]